MTVVDTIYIDFKDAANVLGASEEVSLKIMLESNLRKTLLLSAASYFEYTLCRQVADFTQEVTFGNILIGNLVRTKAISRQYHSWFDWEQSNANKFFSMFGKEFKDHMTARISANEDLAKGIKAFMELGRERNLLVHSDYASYLINKSPEEIYMLYQQASVFVNSVSAEFRGCTAVTTAGAQN
jgi:hypothetical protein